MTYYFLNLSVVDTQINICIGYRIDLIYGITTLRWRYVFKASVHSIACRLETKLLEVI
jgi:hypothetical protein